MSADSAAFVVDFEHDLRGRVDIPQEVFLQYQDDELHRRVIVVEHHDLEQLGRLDALFLAFGDDRALAFVAPRRVRRIGRFRRQRGRV